MSKGSKRRPEVKGNYGQNYDQIFKKKEASPSTAREEDPAATQEKAVGSDESGNQGSVEA